MISIGCSLLKDLWEAEKEVVYAPKAMDSAPIFRDTYF
jgi:hypothetical protein